MGPSDGEGGLRNMSVYRYAQLGEHPGSAQEVDAMAALCHDLKQPLAAIMLISDDQVSDDARLTAIYTQARWMSDAIEDLLACPTRRGKDQADVGAVVSDAVERAGGTARCAMVLDIVTTATVALSSVALGRAMGCLLDNAVRASGSGLVQTTVRVCEMGIEIVVADDGPGLGAIETAHGLGLSIVRALIAPGGGHLGLDRRLGGGTIATLRIPVISAVGYVTIAS